MGFASANVHLPYLLQLTIEYGLGSGWGLRASGTLLICCPGCVSQWGLGAAAVVSFCFEIQSPSSLDSLSKYSLCLASLSSFPVFTVSSTSPVPCHFSRPLHAHLFTSSPRLPVAFVSALDRSERVVIVRLPSLHSSVHFYFTCNIFTVIGVFDDIDWLRNKIPKSYFFFLC